MESLEFYVVRNKEGKYLRSKGYSGYGQSWVSELKKAKVYTKKNGATGQITYWATNYPEYGVPELIPLICTLGEPIPQEDRVSKVKKKKDLKIAQMELYKAQDTYDKSKREVERIKNGDAERRFKKAEIALRQAEDKVVEFKNQ